MTNVTGTYSLTQAADAIGCFLYWLRDQVTARTVPHGRWGIRKGVFFTADQLSEIVASRVQAVQAKPAARSARSGLEPSPDQRERATDLVVRMFLAGPRLAERIGSGLLP
jgi:hypothetical protein